MPTPAGPAGRRLRAGVALATLLAVVTGCGGGGESGEGTSTTTTTGPPPETVPLNRGRQVDTALYVPAIGDCFDRRVPDPEKPLTEVILVLPCREPHTYEVFALWTPEIEPPADGTPVAASEVPYPEVEAFTDEALDECVARLEDFVGRPYELSVLDVEPLLPNPDEWALGNRAVGCLALHRDGELLVGSQRDADI